MMFKIPEGPPPEPLKESKEPKEIISWKKKKKQRTVEDTSAFRTSWIKQETFFIRSMNLGERSVNFSTSLVAAVEWQF